MAYPKYHLKDKRFERLYVVDGPFPGRYWECLCDCGNTVFVKTGPLVRGNNKSCGCLFRPADWTATHGMSKNTTYKAWLGAKQRCTNPNYPKYHRYGGRGITICKRWLDSFENFLEDMGERPTGLTLDRIDNDKGYSKENCRWTTLKEQNRNRGDKVEYTFEGEKILAIDLAEKFGVSYTSLKQRVRINKDTAEQAIKHLLALRDAH